MGQPQTCVEQVQDGLFIYREYPCQQNYCNLQMLYNRELAPAERTTLFRTVWFLDPELVSEFLASHNILTSQKHFNNLVVLILFSFFYVRWEY